MKSILTLFLFSSVISSISAQNFGKYRYENYAVSVPTVVKKAKIDYKSSKTAKMFKTRISENYQNGKVDFAGYFITTIWGCGTGCIGGAMVDTRDGKVYDLPITEKNAWMCYSDTGNEEDRYHCKPNSRLFITGSCQTDGLKNNKYKETSKHYIYVWNDETKKFDFKETLHKAVIKKDEEQ